MRCNYPIPRPVHWKDSRFVSSIPGLSAEEQQELRDALPPAAQKHLNGGTWSMQMPEKLETFMEEIQLKLPFLAQYEDAWPAEGCMRQYLMKRRELEGRRRKRAAFARATSRSSQRDESSAPEALKKSLGSGGPGLNVTVNPLSTGPVQTFLQSICPAMGELTIVFVQGGIVDEAHLDQLGGLQKAEQLQFLRNDLGLNAFQARVVRLALATRKK
ncbi:hypothetical protein PsYK624_064610 [Phanerochaete sordida]|uniref:Uncharacterized protein n=1 Tax=Phanerochaete sordida TaxID=48140 RepID=A0A9P3G8T7_9APHY|nr:hypothetical protein PsYK624_064610 [Phanerochaete sordida]